MIEAERATLSPLLNKLASHSLLDTMDREAFLSLPHRVISHAPAAYLNREGGKADTCMALLSGYTYASKITSSGARQILALHVAGDLLDLHSGLLPHNDHSVQALSPSTVAHIPHREMLNLAEEFPNIARALWRETLMNASSSREWLLNVGRRCARERVSHFLCELAVRQSDDPITEGTQFHLPLTQEQIGDVVGLTAVHVNRTLQGLRADELIHQELRQVTVTDWTRLKAAGDFSPEYLQRPEYAYMGGGTRTQLPMAQRPA